MKFLIYFSALLIFSCSCKKEEDLITGDISGKIIIYNQYGYRSPDLADISVKLFQDTALINNTFTNDNSLYVFDKIPYGKYSVHIQKAGYVQARYSNTIYHVGGYSPTLHDFYLYEVPTYQLSLDSISKIHDYIIVFLKFNGDTLLPENGLGMPLRVFAGNTPDVSSDHFAARGRAHLSDYQVNDYQTKKGVHAAYQEWEMEESFNQLKGDVIYLRIYPVASGQGFYAHDYYPEALGPPSNVIGFIWDDVVQGNQ